MARIAAIAAFSAMPGAPLIADEDHADRDGARWLPLPSGMQARIAEIIWDEDDSLGRFRFIAPALADHAEHGGRMDTDMMTLCREFARPVQRGLRPGWETVVISIADAPVAFGEYDPSVLQLFAGFLLDGGECRWDDF